MKVSRVLKFLLALFLLPAIFWALVETGRIWLHVLGHFKTALSFLSGAVAYAVLHYTVYDFSRPYVFAHEMTHAFAAFVCGGRIKDISVKQNSGYVKMNKTNVFISLAPYFVPGYAVLAGFLYALMDVFVPVTPYRPYFLFVLGFCTAFHFIQTCKTLWEADQPDLQLAGGKVFSLVLIVLANLAVLAVVLKTVFPETVSLIVAAKQVIKGTLNTWRILVNYIGELLLR